MTTTGIQPAHIPPAPRDLPSALALEEPLVFLSFTAITAWELGCLLRARLLHFPTPAVISIASANSSHLLFHATTHPGTAPDNDIWVARKRATVMRWGLSTWAMRCKYGDEAVFAAKTGLGHRSSDYAIHGGGVPVRVRGVEGVVATVVVSGLRQEDDHMVVIEVMSEYLRSLGVTLDGQSLKVE